MKAFKLGIKVAAVAGLTALLSVSASAGITLSKHDLRGTASAMAEYTDAGKIATGTKIEAAGEICAFCHTPHGSSTATEAPLWNKIGGTAAGSFSVYNSSTLDGEVLLANSPSLACLSCHDGAQAMNTVINAPSDADNYFYNSAGTMVIGTASAEGYKIADNIARIGADLQNDHPVAVPYAGGGWSTSKTYTTDGQAVFSADAKDPDFVLPHKDTIGGEVKWWIEKVTGGDDKRTKTDLVLYNRVGGAGGVPYVECATCHDPHAGESQSFLRMGSNDNSQVCLACHIK